MLVSAVIEPSAFTKEYFSIPGYREQAEIFFKGIWINGLLIVDAAGLLRKALVDAISALPTQHGQQLSLYLAEFLKNKRKRVVQCHPDACNPITKPELIQLAWEVKQSCNVDGLIVSDKGAEDLKSGGHSASEITPLSRYINSEFEKRRGWFSDQVPPIDFLTDTEKDELLIRIVKYARWIRFYDKQVGKGDNLSHFRKGIEYVLKLWWDHGHFASRRGGEKVEIITCQKENIQENDDAYIKREKRKRNRDAHRKVMSELIEPLNRKFPWPIELRMKQDPNNIFHARHLEAQVAVVLFDKGFDLFKPNGSVSRNILKIDNSSFEHLKECRDLQDAELS